LHVALDVGALIMWIIISMAFIAIVMILYTRVSRIKNIDENRDEASTY